MSHKIIIIHGDDDGHRMADGSSVSGEITWTPPHGLPPQEEARRRERAERLLGKAAAALDGNDD
jgi:hypothetical protein